MIDLEHDSGGDGQKKDGTSLVATDIVKNAIFMTLTSILNYSFRISKGV